MIIKLRHFIRILKEVILQKHKLLLGYSLSLASIHFSSRPKSVRSVPMSGSHSTAHFDLSLQQQIIVYLYIIQNTYSMNKVLLAVLLIMMMFGHNYVLNQPQVLQKQIQQIHKVTVPQFNLLYSVPSAVAFFFIIPLGVMYDKHAQVILMISATGLVIGQLLVAIFGANPSSYAFPLLTIGRIFQGTTAQVLYMIQANMSSSWMGKLAGLTLILPEVGEIVNVFLTLKIKQTLGVSTALVIGFFTCLLSFIACIFLYHQIKRHKKHAGASQIMVNSPQTKDTNDKDLHMVQETEQDKSMSHSDTQKVSTPVELQVITSKQEQRNKQQKQVEQDENNPSIFKSGKIFWLVVILCAINECLYFPFLDNAKVLIETRFCIDSQKTAFYLCIPYLSAILISILVGEELLYKFQRQKLIFTSSLLPLIGHSIIYFIANCETQTTYFEEICLILGFAFFGMGIAGYYSISMPAVGLSVPQSIRGTAFACLGFFQTLTMTAVPLISGYIIQYDGSNYMEGYRNSSFLFVCLCLLATAVSFYIMKKAKPTSFKYTQQYDQNVTSAATLNRPIRKQQTMMSQVKN